MSTQGAIVLVEPAKRFMISVEAEPEVELEVGLASFNQLGMTSRRPFFGAIIGHGLRIFGECSDDTILGDDRRQICSDIFIEHIIVAADEVVVGLDEGQRFMIADRNIHLVAGDLAKAAVTSLEPDIIPNSVVSWIIHAVIEVVGS
ncbi:MAG: hypothetical protein ACR2RE_15855, partial [Geminicoccaceae bacterium]